MADEPAAIPSDKRPRVWVLLAGVLVSRLLNSLHWALAGGLGWGFGAAAGSLVPVPGSATLGGAVGLALVLLGVLTVGWGERSEHTPITLAAFGGAAVGSASLSLLNPPGREWNLALGGCAGLVIGLCSSVMKQHFAPVSAVPACALAITGAALFAGVGSLVGGPIGWAAGGLSLFWVAVLAECWRRTPAVEIDANEQPIREIPRREMCRQTAWQSWSPSYPLAWGWHGLFGGLLASPLGLLGCQSSRPECGAQAVPRVRRLGWGRDCRNASWDREATRTVTADKRHKLRGNEAAAEPGAALPIPSGKIPTESTKPRPRPGEPRRGKLSRAVGATRRRFALDPTAGHRDP